MTVLIKRPTNEEIKAILSEELPKIKKKGRLLTEEERARGRNRETRKDGYKNVGRKSYKTKNEINCELTITPIFLRNKESQAKIVANRGGARSSKSWSIAQLMLERFFTYPKRQILIIRKTLPSLRTSTLKDMYQMLDMMNIKNLIREEKIALNWHCPFNGSLIHFGGLDDPHKIKSTNFNDIWMEESTDFTYEDFVILKTRLSSPPHEGVRNQIFFSFNPEDEHHWIKEKVIDGPEDCEEIFSSYRDNPFLDPDYMQDLENLLDQDINRYRIYALGEWGRLEDLIYNNWDVIKKMPDDEGSDIFYGVDFGYNNPTALIKVMHKNKELFLEEMLYETKLTNSDLAKKMRDILPLGHRRNCKIYCDNAEPDRLEELKREGFKIIPARKGPNSVKDGIDFIKRRKLHILSTSANLLKEIRTYGWKKDPRDETKFIDEPIKYNDHLMDSLRYPVWTHLGGEGRPRIRVFD